jgi:cytochrome c556
MADEDKIARLQEIVNRGLEGRLSEDQRARLAELQKRGIIKPRVAPQPAGDAGRGMASLNPGGVVRYIGSNPEQRQQMRRDVGEAAKGGGETLLTALTGSLAQIPAGIAGIITTVREGPKAGAERVRDVQGRLTYQPRTQAGQETLEAVGRVMEPVSRAMEGAGNIVLDATGSPALATATRTALEGGLGMLTGRVTPRSVASAVGRRRNAGASMDQVQRGTGVDPGASLEAQGAQIRQSAERLSGNREARGTDMDRVQQRVQQLRTDEGTRVDALYTEARGARVREPGVWTASQPTRSQGATGTQVTRAGPRSFRRDDPNRLQYVEGREAEASVSAAAARKLVDDVEAALEDFDIPILQGANRRMAELRALRGVDPTSSVFLEGFQRFRQRVNRAAKTRDPYDGEALRTIKSTLDNFLESQFNADMVSGSAAALKKWTDANQAFRAYRETFNDNRVIRQLAQQQATPEEVRNWIFGANAVGAKAQSGEVVRRLKRVLGEDSPEFTALRQEATFDIVEPLLRETPNARQFINNYDKFARNNPTLARELLGGNYPALQQLRDIVKGVDESMPPALRTRLNDVIARSAFGHNLSRRGMIVRTATDALDLMRRAVGTSRKRQIMSQVLGYDPMQPLVPARAVPAIAAPSAVGRAGAEERRRQEERRGAR